MNWGRVEVSGSFLLVVAGALYWDNQGIVPLALLACGLHELGHFFVLKGLGGRLHCLRLTGIGAEMVIGGGLSHVGEVMLALAGPLANLVVALIATYYNVSDLFAGLNLALCTLNLIPVSRLDGGTALYFTCCALWGEEVAEGISRLLDGGFALALLVAGVWVLAVGGSFTLLILAVWVAWGQKTWNFPKKTLA